MLATLFGFVIGMTAGAFTGTVLGAFSIGVLGALIGASLYGLSWARAHLGDVPVVEHHRVMCTPFGQAAELEVEGDVAQGRWNDVKRCSLLHPASEIDCEQGCLKVLNQSGVRPGHPCAACQRAAR